MKKEKRKTLSLSGKEGFSREDCVTVGSCSNPSAITICVAYGCEARFSGLTYEKINNEKSVFKSNEIMWFAGPGTVLIQKCEIILGTKTEKLSSNLVQGFLKF